MDRRIRLPLRFRDRCSTSRRTSDQLSDSDIQRDSLARGADAGERPGADRQHPRARDRRTGRGHARRHRHADQPRADLGDVDGRHRCERGVPLAVAGAGHLHREARTCRIPVGGPRGPQRGRRPDDPGRNDTEGRHPRRDGHGVGHVPYRRHDERHRECQPRRAAAAEHPRRPRHLGPGGVQGAQPHDHPS